MSAVPVAPPGVRIALLAHADAAVAAQVLAVLRAAADQEAAWLGTMPGAPVGGAAQALAAIQASPDLHLGAWEGPLLCGVLSLARGDGGGPPEIRRLVVQPQAQRRGIARALLGALLRQGDGIGFVVTAAAGNAAALALYRGLGFVEHRRGLLGALPVVQLRRAPAPFTD